MHECLICSTLVLCESKRGSSGCNIKHVCKVCQKQIRATVKAKGDTIEAFKNFKCTHPQKCWHSRGAVYLRELLTSIDACMLCAEEIRKECAIIKAKARKKHKQNTLATESLTDKCIKVIVNDPGLLLGKYHKLQFHVLRFSRASRGNTVSISR